MGEITVGEEFKAICFEQQQAKGKLVMSMANTKLSHDWTCALVNRSDQFQIVLVRFLEYHVYLFWLPKSVLSVANKYLFYSWSDM